MASKSWGAIGLGILITVLFLSLVVIWKFVDVLLLGLALAYITYPIAKRLSMGDTKKNMKYLLASLASVLIVAIPLIIFLLYGLNMVLQWYIKNLPAITTGRFMAGINVGLNNLGLNIVSDRLTSELGKLITSFSDAISRSVLKPDWLIEFFLKIAIFFVATFYFVYEGPSLNRLIKRNVPDHQRFIKELINSVNNICYGLFVGHFMTSIVIAIIAGIGFWLIIQPTLLMWVLLVILMFIISFLPVIGPWSMYVPMAAWLMVFVPDGVTKGIYLLVFGAIFLTLIPDFYVRPKLVQRGSEIHPLLLILGFFGGPLIMGLKGVVIGPLILGLAQAIIKIYIERKHIIKELIEQF